MCSGPFDFAPYLVVLLVVLLIVFLLVSCCSASDRWAAACFAAEEQPDGSAGEEAQASPEAGTSAFAAAPSPVAVSVAVRAEPAADCSPEVGPRRCAYWAAHSPACTAAQTDLWAVAGSAASVADCLVADNLAGPAANLMVEASAFRSVALLERRVEALAGDCCYSATDPAGLAAGSSAVAPVDPSAARVAGQAAAGRSCLQADSGSSAD